MKRVFLGVLLLCCLNTVDAQISGVSNNLSLGIQLNQFQNDFGGGMVATSPFFVNNKIAFRFRGNVMFHHHASDNDFTFSPYLNFQIGLIGVSGTIDDKIRLYGEGGFVGLIPSTDFSTERFKFGGYGLFGFEFFMSPNNNYFIELGGIGTGAKADKVEYGPIYSNGFLISTGFRIHL